MKVETAMTRLGRLYALAEAKHPNLMGIFFGRERARKEPRKALERLVSTLLTGRISGARAKYIRDLVAGVTAPLYVTPAAEIGRS